MKNKVLLFYKLSVGYYANWVVRISSQRLGIRISWSEKNDLLQSRVRQYILVWTSYCPWLFLVSPHCPTWTPPLPIITDWRGFEMGGLMYRTPRPKSVKHVQNFTTPPNDHLSASYRSTRRACNVGTFWKNSILEPVKWSNASCMYLQIRWNECYNLNPASFL